jgi:Fe-S oxidoreductase
MTKNQADAINTPSPSEPFNFAEHFGTMRVLGEILRTEDRRPWVTNMPKTPEHHRHAIWLGCHVLRVAHLAETLDDILNHLKEDFVTLGGPSNCCGIVHELNGELAVSKNMLRHTVNKLEAFTPEQMLYWCPSCDNQLRGSPAEQQSELAKARISVIHFLAEQLPRMALRPVKSMKIAIHSHGGFAEQDGDAIDARSILSQIPGVEVVDMPPITRERHCTDGGIRSFGKNEYSESIREWTQEARRLGANHVTPIYHSCHRQILLAARSWKPEERLPVNNYLTILSESLGLPTREDKFAHCADVNDIDRMLEHIEPDLTARGIRADLAKRALTAQFGS